jgi:cysteine-rich repeat protein
MRRSSEVRGATRKNLLRARVIRYQYCDRQTLLAESGIPARWRGSFDEGGSKLMSKRFWTRGFLAALALLVSAWLSGAAQAGPTNCGNGTIDTGETCDDSNTANGDGCDSNCQLEVCGNTFVQPGTTPPEECDDGNTVDDDGCTAPDCQFDCGDGEVDNNPPYVEACDDGGTPPANGDGCDNDPSATSPGNCTATACGNGVVTGTEQCDDGNTDDNDECKNDCTLPTVALDKKEQGCANALNGNMAKVVKAQDKDNAACLKDAAKNGTAIGTCIGADLDGKVAAAQAKTTATDSGKKCTGEGSCVETDDFCCKLGDTAINPAAENNPIAAFTRIFGATPTIAPSSDKPIAGCQSEVLKRANKLTETWLSEFNKNKKKLLKGSKTVPAVPNPALLATGVDAAIAASTKITNAENGVNSGIEKKCLGVTIDPNFDCNGATTTNELALCVIATAEDAACRTAEAGDGLALTCPDVLP